MSSVLHVEGLAKTYPGVRALRGVGFDVEAGEVHALLGENGAGKSTLIRLLSGVELPDSGAMTLAGRDYAPSSPLAALADGVSTLYQEQNLLPDRSVTHNVLIGRLPRRWGLMVDGRAARRTTREALDRVGAGHIDVDATVGSLAMADRQMVDIARALHREARLLILDEPTAALTAQEVDSLFAVLAGLPAHGISIMFVSHRLEEIFRLCTSVTVLRDGEHVLTSALSQLTPDDLVTAMVGDSARTELAARTANASAEVVMAARGLRGPGFHDIDLEVRAGEIVALAGVTGSGKEQLGQALYGATPFTGGRLEIDGRRVRLSPRRAAALGVVGVPADRKSEGVIGELSVTRNLALPSLGSLSRLGVIRSESERTLADRRIQDLSIKVADRRTPVMQLSGGNQQKVSLGKWLARSPRVLVLGEPTQGVDIRVRYEFYRLVRSLAEDGVAVVLVSSDVPEVLSLSDRTVVLRHGRVVADRPTAELDADTLVRLSLGQQLAGGDPTGPRPAGESA